MAKWIGWIAAIPAIFPLGEVQNCGNSRRAMQATPQRVGEAAQQRSSRFSTCSPGKKIAGIAGWIVVIVYGLTTPLLALETVSGFLYQTAEGQVIIAPEPDLPTCCRKAEKHLVVEGWEGPLLDGYAVELRGSMQQRGETDIFIVTTGSQKQVVPWKTAALSIALIATGGLIWKRRRDLLSKKQRAEC